MEAFNIWFVGEVEKHPELYDFTVPEYSRKDFLEKAWNEISKTVNLPVGECKDKWRNLRTTFVRYAKNGSKTKKQYYLNDAMQFTIPFLKTLGQPTGNVTTNPDEQSETSEDAYEVAMMDTSAFLETLDKPQLSAESLQPPSPPTVSYQPPATLSSKVHLTQRGIEESSHAQPKSTAGKLVTKKKIKLEVDEDAYEGAMMDTSAFLETLDKSQLSAESLQPPSPPTVSYQPPATLSSKVHLNQRGIKDSSHAQPKSITGKLVTKKKIKLEVDEANKNVKPDSAASPDKRELSVKQFLYSLVPDLMSMSDVQLRAYKRRSIILIDDILGITPL